VTGGPFGTEAAGLRSMGITLAGDRAVGVTRDGARALLAPVGQPGAVVEVVGGANDLLRPRFDFADRLWLVDRTRAGARVLLRNSEGRAEEVQVPGVSGRNVTGFLVSRDSSRLLAVIRGPSRDRLVVLRVEHGGAGAVPKFDRPREITLGS